MNGGAAVRRQFKEIIDRKGWAVTGVPDAASPFAYTVGLTRHRHPELGMIGLPVDTAHGLLNTLAGRVFDGAQYTPGWRIGDLLVDYEVVLVGGRPQRRLWPVAAYGLYGRDRVRLLQVVWPDRFGRFPWEAGCELGSATQPVIGRP